MYSLQTMAFTHLGGACKWYRAFLDMGSQRHRAGNTLESTFDKWGGVCSRTEVWLQVQACVISLSTNASPYPRNISLLRNRIHHTFWDYLHSWDRAAFHTPSTSSYGWESREFPNWRVGSQHHHAMIFPSSRAWLRGSTDSSYQWLLLKQALSTPSPSLRTQLNRDG